MIAGSNHYETKSFSFVQNDDTQCKELKIRPFGILLSIDIVKKKWMRMRAKTEKSGQELLKSL